MVTPLFSHRQSQYEPLQAGGQGYALFLGEWTLSSFGAHTAALTASSFENEREKFFRILLHDDRKSRYFVSSDAGGTWVDNALLADGLARFPFNLVSNYYISHNGFNGNRRLLERTRQINALFFDIDCHKEPSQAKREAIISSILDRITDAVLEEKLPMPTLIVDSGRGVQFYYVLQRSIPYRFKGDGSVNEKGISFYKDVQRRLADVIEEQLEGLDLVELDRRVFDHTRVGRVPGTFNTKAGRCARLVNACEVYYHLPLLAAYRPSKEPQKALPAPSRKMKPAFVMKFNALMMSRLSKVVELQEYRKFDCEGSRELMCFVFYNTAVQIYSKEDAFERLVQFNSRFLKPLAHSEMDGIVSAVSSVINVKGEKGHYILSAQTIIEYLGLTDEEMEATMFFASKRMTERLAAKRKTKEKRNARDERIVELYQTGCMTQKEVACEVGCSPRTVQSVLRDKGLTCPRKTSKDAHRTLSGSQQGVKAAAGVYSAYNQAVLPGSSFLSNALAKNWHTCLSEVVKEEFDSFLDQDFSVREIEPAQHRRAFACSRLLFRDFGAAFAADLLPFRLSEALDIGLVDPGRPPLAEPG